VERKLKNAFAVWITGLPASGKSTLTRSLQAQLAQRGVDIAVLESDVLRQIFTPKPTYSEEERDAFYTQLAYVGEVLAQHGVPVIFDATANRRAYRDRARRQIPHFVEVYLECPLELCVARDPKGIYRDGQGTVPGLQAVYEAPDNPDVLIFGGQETPEVAAERVIAKLQEKGYLM